MIELCMAKLGQIFDFLLVYLTDYEESFAFLFFGIK
jgi:hypothetical protein